MLLARGLIGTGDMVDDGFIVVEAFRRNRNFKVFRNATPSYVVKQGVDADGRRTVAHEAAIYRMLARRDAPEFASLVPGFHGHDAALGVLITELRRGTHDLSEHSRRVSRFSAALAAGVGGALASLHAFDQPEQAAVQLGWGLGRQPPWILQVHRPQGLDYVRMGAGALGLLRIIQQSDELCAELDGLHRHWRTDHLIHADLKWENCLVLAGRSDGRRRIRLIDWEFARLGDAAWDVGSMFANYLAWWLGSFDDMRLAGSVEGLAGASFPLERMQPALRAFWAEYRHVAGLENTRPIWLLRATRCAGARLVQTAYEQSQHMPRVTRHAVGLLQLGSSVLTRPLEAAVQLLGLHLGPAQ